MDRTAKIILFSIIVTVLVTMILLFKYKVISQMVFFIFLFVLILSEIIMLVVAVMKKIKKSDTVVEDKVKNNSFRHIFDRINQELEQMPDSDMILWERGSNVSTKTKEYKDSNNKTQRFISIVANTKYGGKEVVVYYNITEDIFWDWNSDPSPTILHNPFDGFEPYPKTYSGGFGYPGDLRSRYGKKKKSRGINISLPGDDYDNPRDRNVDDFVDSIDLGQNFR